MKVDLSCVPSEVIGVLRRLNEAGKQAYLVGGFVRDLLLGRPVHDFDVTTSSLPEDTLTLFSCDGYHTVPTGMKHGTVTVIRDHIPVEVTTFRLDGTYSDGRHPDEVVFTPSLREDLARRDFTVNALAVDADGEVYDFFDGITDLNAGVLRAVGEPERRFSEDALRIMRAFRFSAQLGFSIDSDTLKALAVTKTGLCRISGERIRAEWMRLLENDSVSQTIALLVNTGVWDEIFPNVPSDEMSVRTVNCLPCVPVIRFGYLLSGAADDSIEEILDGLHLSREEYGGILQTVKAFRRDFSDSRVGDARRFLGEVRPSLHKDLPRALFAAGMVSDEWYREATDAVEGKRPLGIGDLAVHGDDLMKIGYRGKEIGEILSFALELVLSDPSLNEKSVLLQKIGERKQDAGLF